MNILPFNEPFKAAWEEWLAYRKERRLPSYKPVGLKKTLTRLIQLADNSEAEAIKIIDYSISQNYQGLFKERSYAANKSISGPTGNKHSAGANLLLKQFTDNLKAIGG